MLPKELLDVRRTRGRITPKFAGERDYELAENIIRVFRAGIGRKYGRVLAKLKELENAANFRKVRGFVRVLENYCIEKACAFGVDSEIDPYSVRMLLFERGFVTTKKERDRAVEYAARYFNTTPETIERAMYADREEEMIITDFKLISPENLIKLYNLSLLQTTLFNALRLSFWVSDNHKEIFRAIKRLRLMYELYEDGGKLMVDVTGAATMLRMTRRYGTAFAKLVPYILKAGNWQMRAEILDSGKIYFLEIDDRMRELFIEKDEKIEYDSSIEEEFARKMRMLGYNILREPDVVKAGNYAFIPDFAVDINGERVYIEIVGFWTKEYLERKLEKVEKSRVPLIVIARDDFGEGKVDNVIKFSRKIPYGDVLKALRKFRRGGEVKGDVVELDSFESLPEGYVLVGKYAVKKEVFEKVRKELHKMNPETLDEAKSVLERYGLGESAISAFGFKVRWIGLGDTRLEKV
ncbi:DUF790 family protein [Archaeoglobus neptunius]|uniref:DUF790 family protein n=1 Tax=Archaeoglobus neptunius TaxID=2798580 RepID=UPI0019262668|nr:DUF790 family protein [Archaeoglobus neptunius]